MSDKTAGAVRARLEENAEIPHFGRREDPRTGRLSQPASKPAEHIDRSAAEVLPQYRPTIPSPTSRPVTGVDGKTYVKPPRPASHLSLAPPPPDPDVQKLRDAENWSSRFALWVNSLLLLEEPVQRDRFRETWTLGSAGASPSQRACVTPEHFRLLADSLIHLGHPPDRH